MSEQICLKVRAEASTESEPLALLREAGEFQKICPRHPIAFGREGGSEGVRLRCGLLRAKHGLTETRHRGSKRIPMGPHTLQFQTFGSLDRIFVCVTCLRPCQGCILCVARRQREASRAFGAKWSAQDVKASNELAPLV